MEISADSLSHSDMALALRYHPAAVLPCALLLLVCISPDIYLWPRLTEIQGAFYCIGFLVYNVTFHPLAKFPGPKLYAATSLFYSRMALRGKLPMEVRELHKKYGDVVRVSPDQLSITNPEAWKDIYGNRPGQPQRPKDLRQVSVGPNSTPSILRADDQTHGRYRRSLSHGFSEGSLQKQEAIVKGYIDLLVQRLHGKLTAGDGRASVDMVPWYNFTTFDIIGDLVFGESFGCLEESKYHFWVRVLFSHFRLAVWAQFFRRIPGGAHLMKWIVPKKVQNEKNIQTQLTEAKVQSRIQKGSSRPDFLSNVLSLNGTGKGMTVAELVSNSYVLIIAGSETTATLLSGVTYYMLTVPGVFDKLKTEIRSTFSSEEEITWSAVNQLKYALAVLNEALRMYPPLPIAFPRVVEGKGDFICDRWVPGGTSVGVAIFASQRHSDNFKHPDKFIPERFLGDPEFDSDKRHALQPFSIGPRNCLGRNLAYAEMRLVLARMVWNFDMELAPESRNWIDHLSFVVWDKPGLQVKLTAARGA